MFCRRATMPTRRCPAPPSTGSRRRSPNEEGGGSRGVYNKAEYEQQRRHMLQEWADMIDAWTKGRNHTPTLLPPSVPMITPEVTVSPPGSSAAARRGRELA